MIAFLAGLGLFLFITAVIYLNQPKYKIGDHIQEYKLWNYPELGTKGKTYRVAGMRNSRYALQCIVDVDDLKDLHCYHVEERYEKVDVK